MASENSSNNSDKNFRADRILILIAIVMFFFSTLFMFKDDFSFQNPLSTDGRKMGNILQGQGDIRWKRFDRIGWEAAEDNTDLYMQDQIFVGKNSNLEIVLDGVKIKLQQNTLISIRKAKGSIDLQIMYGKVTVDKPQAAKKIVMRNQHNQTVWTSDDNQTVAIKTVDVTPEIVTYKTDHVAELEKMYWLSAPAVAEPILEAIPEPPAPVAPPQAPVVQGLKMAQIESAPFHDKAYLDKVEKRKELLAQNEMNARAETVIQMQAEPLRSERKIFTIWSLTPFALFKNAMVDNSVANVANNGVWAPGLQIEYRRKYDSMTMSIPLMWAASTANVGRSTYAMNMIRTGAGFEFPGSELNYFTGAQVQYENYVTTNSAKQPQLTSRTAVPLYLGVSKQWVDGAMKYKGNFNWCPTYSVTASTTNFVCLASSLNSYWMSPWDMNFGGQLFVNYYNLDLKTEKMNATEIGVGVGAEF